MEATFYIERDGTMSNIELAESSGLKVFDDMLITSLSKIKNKWKPGTIHGSPYVTNSDCPSLFQIKSKLKDY